MSWRTEQTTNGWTELESPFINEQAWTPGAPPQHTFMDEADAGTTEWEDAYEAGTEGESESEEDRFEGYAAEAEAESFGSSYELDAYDSGQMEQEDEAEEDRFALEHEGLVCRECGTAHEADHEAGFEAFALEAFAFESGEEAESLRQDQLAQEAELGIGETPFVERFEGEGASDVPAAISSFAATLGAEWSRRRNGTPAPEAMTTWLLQDYRDTFVGAKKRWAKQWGTGRFTTEALGRAWMISRRENMLFQQGSAGVKALGTFAPPSASVALVPTDLVEDSRTSPVAALVVSFMKELRQRFSGWFRAANYPGHGGGKFNGRGFSLDLYLKAVDDRGFYNKDEAVRFLQKLHEAATAVNAQWRIIYNDFSVADAVNRALGRQHVIFVGNTRKTGGKVSGLNWHGPAPLILHFHLDLAPLSGPASRWSGAAPPPAPITATPTKTATTAASTRTGAFAPLEQQLLAHVKASWQRAGMTPPEQRQLGSMKSGKKGFKRYISSGLFVDDIASELRKRNLLSISDDDIDMLQRASNVETGGRLTALNSWDSAFMSVGFMQWTLKYKKLQQWIALAPDAFRRYGIELEPTRMYTVSAKHKEKAIVGAAKAADLRSSEWGVRFSLASLDQDAIIAEYRRALEVSVEVRRAIVDPHGAKAVAHYNASPVLRALVQETHNNRPAYMKQAMRNAASKSATDATTFLELVRKEIVQVYTEKENAPNKAANLIRKTKSRRV